MSSSSSSSPSFGGPMAAMPRLLVCPEGLEDPNFLQHFEKMGLTPAQEAELVAVLKRLTLPMDQIVAHGRASQATQATQAAAAPGAPPRPPLPPPLSFFPPSPEALLLMTGMANGGAAGGGRQQSQQQPQSRMPPPPAPAAPPVQPAPEAKADEKDKKEEKGDRVVLVTVAGDRGGGARLFYPSRLAREGTEAAFRKEVSGLVATHLLPLLLGGGEEAGSLGDGGEGIVEKAGIEWRPAASYRRTVLRLTAGLPTVVLMRRDGEEGEEEGWRKWEEEGAKDPPPSTCDVMVKGVV